MVASALTSALGVTTTTDGGTVGVWSASADSLELCLYSDKDPAWLVEAVPMTRGADDVWTAASAKLTPGRRYGIRATGPTGPKHRFDKELVLLDPYARGIQKLRTDEWRSVVVDGAFDWGTSAKPRTGLDRTVIYEAHVKGFTKLAPEVPAELRGTYAGLAHPATIAYLTGLGATAVELLPIHYFASEQRLIKQGLVNYWGYNSVGFFAPHPLYATRTAQAAGPGAVLREFKGMVKLLHEAGLEVILDVVYNHTAEEGIGGPTSSFRGLDNANYYRQQDDGTYIDTTGCGNTIDFTQPASARLVRDSLRFWANECQVDGFRFDLAVVLGRGNDGAYDPQSRLLYGLLDDPALEGVEFIAEPWDVGLGGWQTGNFPPGWSEWNDRYRDRVRNFWLRYIADARTGAATPTGIGGFATRLAGSSNTFSTERGPLASVNFITAHDGFTLADLVSYDEKHNLGNGEFNRDGTDNNRSFNHGAEGPTDDRAINAVRRKAMRNLLGTLLLSAGVPMLTAGDEFGRSQMGNNNAYCHDDELTWVRWDRDEAVAGMQATATKLIALRRENPALRPVRYGKFGETVPSASQMDWYDVDGTTMSESDWQSPANRTLQYLAASTPEFEDFNRILLIVHGVENDVRVTLPAHEGVSGYTRLWNSADETPSDALDEFAPGDTVAVTATSMQLFRAH